MQKHPSSPQDKKLKETYKTMTNSIREFFKSVREGGYKDIDAILDGMDYMEHRN